MYSTEFKSLRQQQNYSRIPNSVIDSKSLTLSEKKLLLFLYGIQLYWHIPLCNIIRGWTNNKKSLESAGAPAQLRAVLKSLEQKQYITRIFTNKALSSVKLNTDHPEITESKYFYLGKEILSNPNLTLQNYLVIGAYARYYNQKINYTSKLSAILGMSPTTFRKNVVEVNHEGVVIPKITRLPNGIIATTYKLKSEYYLPVYRSKTLGETIHTQLADIWCLKDYFLTKIKNNISMKGIIKMEQAKNNKKLIDYAAMSTSEFTMTLNAVHCLLQSSGCVHSRDYVRSKIISILFSNELNKKTSFENDSKFYNFLAASIRNLNRKQGYNPLNHNFILSLLEEMEVKPTKHVLYTDIEACIALGFTFKTEDHALRFFLGRYQKKQFTEQQRLEGLQEKINDTPVETVRAGGDSESIGDIIKRMYPQC